MKIQIKIKKTNGSLEALRFRVRDGRSVELYYSAKEMIDIRELARCYDCTETDSQIICNLQEKSGVRRINEELRDTIKNYTEKIEKVYSEIKGNAALLNSKALKERVEAEINGTQLKKNDDVLEVRYESYIESQHDNGLLSDGRYRHYQVSLRELKRFLIINKMTSITCKEFDGAQLLQLRTFLINEYKYVSNHRPLYAEMDERQIPSAPRSQNTIASKMKFYRTFFNYLCESGEIDRSPFSAVGSNNRKQIMREKYDDPVFLTTEELQKIHDAELPEDLKEVRDCFLLHCQLGCRIEDYKALSLRNVKVSNEGFAYVEYMPSKTAKENAMVVQTPLMKSGLKTVKKYGFSFPCLRNLWGKSGYNHQIKEIVRLSGIEREVTVTVGGMKSKKICDLASTKFARKTFVSAMQQVQIDDFAAGLHSNKSDAVYRYGNASNILENRYVLMCTAFNEKPYKTDSNLSL